METVYLVECTKFQVHEGEKFYLKNSSKFHDKEILLENSKKFHIRQVETLKILNETTYQVYEVGSSKKNYNKLHVHFISSNWKKFDKKTLINFMYTKEKSLIGKLSGIPSTQSGKS